MPEVPYQSTPADRRRAVLLGLAYVLMAIILAIMLFKIWPPTPWPSDKDIENNPQLALAFSDCECPTPSPTPTPQPGATTRTGTQTGSQPGTAGSPATPTPALILRHPRRFSPYLLLRLQRRHLLRKRFLSASLLDSSVRVTELLSMND